MVACAARLVYTIDTIRVVFDDVTDENLAKNRAEITADALTIARRFASQYLAAGPGVGLTADRITNTLLAHDPADADYERLAPFEKRWAVLVIKILSPVADPTAAVTYAYARGASWTAIGRALGTSRQSAHKRFSKECGIATR